MRIAARVVRRLPITALLLFGGAAFGGPLSGPLVHATSAAPGQVRSAGAPQETHAAALRFSGDVGLISFPVDPARSQEFASVMLQAGRLLENSPMAVHKRQAQGWRLLKQVEPGPRNTVIYLLLLDPVVRDADYSLRSILQLATGEEPDRLQQAFSGALAGQPIQADCHVVMAMAATPQSGAAAPSAAPAGAPQVEGAQATAGQRRQDAGSSAPLYGRVFSGDVGIQVSFIKADKAEDFESAMSGLRDALGRSSSATRQRQAAGWRVLRQKDGAAAGEVVYLYLIDPVEKDAEYSPARIVSEILTQEATVEFVQRYTLAFARGVSLLNFSLVSPGVIQR
jgi:hypothetical protein